jgi:type I restriction enzyme S subunit
MKFPQFWDVKQIKELAFTTAGGTPFTGNREFWGGNIPWMNSGELNLKTVRDVEGRITEKGLENSSTKLIPKHCVLIGLAGQGKTRGTVATNEIELCTNQSIAAIFPGKEFNYKYLYYNLELRYQELRELSDGGGGRGGLNLFLINNLELPLPNLSEQKAIAEALSDIDELINILNVERSKLINMRLSFIQSQLLKEQKARVKLGNHAQFYKGKGLPKSQLSNEGKFEAIHYGELFTNYPETIKEVISRTNIAIGESFLSEINDVLMPSSDVTPRGLATASCITKVGVILGGDVLVVRADSNVIDGSYLSYVIRNSKDEILKLVNGTTVYHLYGKDLANFEFELPALDVQKEFIEKADLMRDEIDFLSQEIEKYEWLKQGMMNDLLTGKVRLV